MLPLDRYVQGVVPSEVPTSWPADAVRAQAVAARTYAAFEREAATDYYDICDTTSCQVYGGLSAEDAAANDAVRATRGRVVLYEGLPAFTQFSSSNGGYSSAGSQPYLVAQPDPYEASSDNPNDPWTATVTQRADREGLARGRHPPEHVVHPGRARCRSSAAGSPRSGSPAAWVACPPP